MNCFLTGLDYSNMQCRILSNQCIVLLRIDWYCRFGIDIALIGLADDRLTGSDHKIL